MGNLYSKKKESPAKLDRPQKSCIKASKSCTILYGLDSGLQRDPSAQSCSMNDKPIRRTVSFGDVRTSSFIKAPLSKKKKLWITNLDVEKAIRETGFVTIEEHNRQMEEKIEVMKKYTWLPVI